jgi:hypothetical protein
MLGSEFPPKTPVSVRQTFGHGPGLVHTEVAGVVEAWEDLPTGSWYAHGKGAKLWLKRLTLRKVDGEISVLVIDGRTTIARLEAAPPAEL